MTKEEIKQLRDKLITWEHGKPPRKEKPPYWDCDCFSDKRIKELVKIFKN